jgi:hypothetical protein
LSTYTSKASVNKTLAFLFFLVLIFNEGDLK